MTSPESPCPCVAGEDVPGSSTSWAAAFLDFVDNITGEPESLPRQRGRALHSPEFVCGSSLTTILYEHPIRRRHHVEHHLQHSKIIFDNIMNREIPWPRVPEELSFEAYDLIDKLLMENPVQRLGATGGGEGR